MSYESEINVVQDDFGYDLEFSAVDANDNVIPLNFLCGVTPFTFNVWVQSRSGAVLVWQDNVSGNFTVVNASGGLFRWNVPSGVGPTQFFRYWGLYEGEMELHMYSGLRVVSLTDLHITVVRESP